MANQLRCCALLLKNKNQYIDSMKKTMEFKLDASKVNINWLRNL